MYNFSCRNPQIYVENFLEEPVALYLHGEAYDLTAVSIHWLFKLWQKKAQIENSEL